jgi:hypothetical protein
MASRDLWKAGAIPSDIHAGIIRTVMSGDPDAAERRGAETDGARGAGRKA